MTRALIQAPRQCIICQQSKDSTEFGAYAYTTNQGKRSRRYNSRCRPCEVARRASRYQRGRSKENRLSRAYKAANAKAVSAGTKHYRSKNRDFLLASRRASEAKRRAVAGDNPADGEDYKRVLDEARFGDLWLDAYSGILIDNPTVDHIVAISRGGAHEYGNLCVTSRPNNASKHNKPLIVWMALQ